MSPVSADLFNVERLKGQGVIRETAGGRGTSSIVRFPDRTWVLRHYRRGGLVGKVLNDQYFGFSREKSRPWLEWKLLHLLRHEGLPVPQPIAAAYVPGCGYYRADLITGFISDTQTLSQILSAGPLAKGAWQDIGACIARFHARGVCHADLNAHNILLDDAGEVFLIDFDRGAIRRAGGWQQQNIERLLRSFTKISKSVPTFHFTASDWAELLTGYRRS